MRPFRPDLYAAALAAGALSIATAALLTRGPAFAGILTGALALVGLAYLAFGGRIPADGEMPQAPPTEDAERARWGILLLLVAAILAMGRVRVFAVSDLYYPLAGIAGALVAWEVLTSPTERARAHGVMRASILWSALIFAKQLPYSRGLSAPDAGAHLKIIIEPILSTGHIPPGESYTGFPLHHLMVAAATLLTGGDDPRALYAFVGTLLAAILPLVVFVGLAPLGSRVAAAGALAVMIFAYTTNIATHPSPLTFALPFAVLSLAIVTKRHDRALPLSLAGILGVVGASIHPYSTAILLLALGVFLLADSLDKPRRQRIVAFAVASALGVLFLAGMALSGTAELVKRYLQQVGDATRNGVTPGATNYYDTIAAPVLLANLLPFVTVLAAALVGSLWLLRQREALERHALGTLLGLATFAGLLGLPLIFSDRWYLYLELLCLAPFVGVFMVRAASSRPRAIAASLAFGVLLALIPASFIAGAEQSYLTSDVLHMRTYLTGEESELANWIDSRPIMAVAVPGCLHERPNITEVERYAPLSGNSLVLEGIPRPSLAMLCESAKRDGVPGRYLPGDVVGGTVMVRLNTTALESGQHDRVAVGSLTSAYRLR